VQLPTCSREELGVLGIRPRPTSFDESHSEIIQLASDRQLVVHREVQAFLLCTVAQCGVVHVEVSSWDLPAMAHDRSSFTSPVETKDLPSGDERSARRRSWRASE